MIFVQFIMQIKIPKYCTILLLLLIGLFVVFQSCKKDDIQIQEPTLALQFSNDSIVFDTVFTSIGSITKELKVYNPYGHKINILSIQLKGGEESAYRLNIDGTPALEIENIEIQGGDSMYIFVRVLIDPNDVNNPFVVDDQIQFKTTGYSQNVELVAWGQNANYIIADQYINGLPPFSIIGGENEHVTWNNTKPYLIYGYAVVDSGSMLQIEAGTKVHFHNNAGLWIYKGGNLKVMGTLENPVVFEGDRLDEDYRDLPGQWDRIWINEGSVDNEINYAIIKNGYIGLQVETLVNSMGNKLNLTNTQIFNMSGSGILARNYHIQGSNNLIANCGKYLAELTEGGDYKFIHSTFANHWDASVRQTPSMYLNNYKTAGNNNLVSQPFNSYFGNCIIDGREDNELFFDFFDEQNPTFKFEYSTLKTTLNISGGERFIECLINPESLFENIRALNFQLNSLSPAIDKGSVEIAKDALFDILGNSRALDPDLGAFEFMKDLPKQ